MFLYCVVVMLSMCHSMQLITLSNVHVISQWVGVYHSTYLPSCYGIFMT